MGNTDREKMAVSYWNQNDSSSALSRKFKINIKFIQYVYTNLVRSLEFTAIVYKNKQQTPYHLKLYFIYYKINIHIPETQIIFACNCIRFIYKNVFNIRIKIYMEVMV